MEGPTSFKKLDEEQDGKKQTAVLESEEIAVGSGRGGKGEACGYLCASCGRGPDSINPSFYVVAILALGYLDSSCYDPSNSKFEFDGMKCTQYSYIDFTYKRSSLEAVKWRSEHDMDNITEGQKGLMSYGCGYSADPCMQPLKGDEIKYPGFDTKLHNLPNDWYPKFHRSMVEGVDFIQNISEKVPAAMIPKKSTCDCRGGNARLGSSNGIAPSTVVSYSLPIIAVINIIFLPYVGALTDYTPHRKLIWLIFFGVLVSTTILTAVMWHNYVWVVALACSALTSVAFDIHLFPIQAYLAEMGDTKTVLKLSAFSQGVYACAQVVYIIIGVACSVMLPAMFGRLYGTVIAAMVMTILCGLWAIAATVPAAFKMQKRSATPLPEEWKNKPLVVVGFLRLGRTACEALKQYPQVIKYWVYHAWMYTWAVAVLFLAPTYLSQQLRMNQTENVLFVLCNLIFVIVGALSVVGINRCVAHKWILVGTSIFGIVISILPAIILWEPRFKIFSYPYGVLAGLAFGAYLGLQSGVYATIMPGGQEAEYTAVGMWCGNLLRWLPGVIYGVMVDLSPTQSHRWAFFHLGVYPLIALIILIFIDFNKAEQDIASTLDKRKTDNKQDQAMKNVVVVTPKD